MAKNNSLTTAGSVIVGTLTYSLLGFAISNGLEKLGIIKDNLFVMLFLLGAGAMLGLYLGTKHPILAEGSSFAITLLIAVQALWDINFDIVNSFTGEGLAAFFSAAKEGLIDKRVYAFVAALSIFIINIFTGKLRKGRAKKEIKNTFS